MNNILTPLDFMNIPGSNAETTKAYLDLWEYTQTILKRLQESEYERFKSEPYDIRWEVKT